MSRGRADMSPLHVFIAAYEALADPDDNRRLAETALYAGARAGVRLVVLPECLLTGYPGAGREDLAGLDWCRIGDHEDHLITLAKRLGLALVCGSAEPVAGGFANIAFAGGAGVEPVRYRKCHLTPADERHFVAGSQPVWFDLDGWRLGLGICFDLRFAGHWAALAAAGCDAFVVPAHMAGVDVDPGTKAQVVPALCSTRAAEWATPLILANTAAGDRWLDAGAWDARGVQCARISEGHIATTIEARAACHPWYADLRRRHLDASPCPANPTSPPIS